MTTLIAPRMFDSGLEGRAAPGARRSGLRAVLARMAFALRAGADRRHLADLPDHILRDVGLTRSQVASLGR